MDDNVVGPIIFLVVFAIFSIGAFLSGVAEADEMIEQRKLREKELELLEKLLEDQRK